MRRRDGIEGAGHVTDTAHAHRRRDSGGENIGVGLHFGCARIILLFGSSEQYADRHAFTLNHKVPRFTHSWRNTWLKVNANRYIRESFPIKLGHISRQKPREI